MPVLRLLAAASLSATAVSAQTRDEIVVRAPLSAGSEGQTETRITEAAVRDTPAATVADLVRLSPGVTVIGGNGPRDIGVSIRGSNARGGFGARNIQVLEDGFPVTQPDGLARFDLADPHAYASVDVVRGPASARYGNYAIEGAIDFRTRRIDGVDGGADVGGDGYRNAHATIGAAGAGYDAALFGSYVTGDGATGHTGYRTTTLNGLATLALSPRDRLTAKLIRSDGTFRLSTRLSFDQFGANPYQQGCAAAATAAPGCGTISVLLNGTNGARIAQTAAEGDLARDDRRTIVGLRHEHDLSPSATWRIQAVYDVRDVYQPTSASPFRGTLNSYNLATEVAGQGWLIGAFYNHLDNHSLTFNKTPAGRDGFGAPLQTVFGDIDNYGARARAEAAIAPRLTLVGAAGIERSVLDLRQVSFTYPASGPVRTAVPALRRFLNLAPEASLVWQADPALRLHTRVATAYGIPQSGQLFVTAAGVPGNNAALKAQRNTGVDVGGALTLGRLSAELTGYWEWFRNEQVSQSAGVNLLSFTTNAPRSVHRGVELAVEWRPAGGAYARANYSYNDQRYTRYVERLTSGAATAAFDRDGNRIPGAIPGFANLRLGYDAARGLGGFAELTYRSRYAIDNANLLDVPGYALVNLDLHYAASRRLSLYAALQNLADKTYVGSATVIADSLDAAGRQNPAPVLRGVSGSLYPGQPRTFYAGIRGSFR